MRANSIRCNVRSCSKRPWRGADRTFRRRGERRQPVSQILFPAGQAGAARLLKLHAHQRSAGHRRGLASGAFDNEGVPPAGVRWWKMACCAVISSAVTPPASSACKPRAMPAARTTSSCSRVNSISTDCYARCSAACWSPSCLAMASIPSPAIIRAARQVLGRARRDPISGGGNHHRRQPERYVQTDRRCWQRRAGARGAPMRVGIDREHDGGGALTRCGNRKM